MTAVGLDRPVHFPFGRDRVIAIAIAAIVMCVMVLPELQYVPIWDGRVYANCVMEAASRGLHMEDLRCAGHPSQGWAIWLVIPQYVAPNSVAAIHLTNLVLGVVAIIAFRVVLARAFPAPEQARELDLVAIAAAAHPIVISTLLQVNVDFGVYVWFFVALAGMLSPGGWGTAAAVMGGLFLVFSKETGVAAYGLAVLAALAIDRARSPAAGIWRVMLARRRQLGLFAIPPVLFVLYVLWSSWFYSGPAIWRHGWQESAADGFNFFDLSEPVFVSYAAGLFILGFMWVAWLPVAIDGGRALFGTARRLAPRPVAGADNAVLDWLTVLTAVLTYVLTSFRTWSNLRYFALLYPLFLLLMYAALVRLGLGPKWRRAALVAVAALFVVASYRSVDPLSRLVYGTFDTGVRRMYRMTSITDEFEGPGRDQLVYNLEFTGYHHVQNELYRRIAPTDSTVIGTPRIVRWNIWSQLDPVTHERTMRRTGVITPIYADEVDIASRRSPAAWYLDFSNRSESDATLRGLLKDYTITDSMTVVSRGQRVVARHLVRREASVLP